MKLLTICILLIALLAGSFSQCLLISCYSINKNYIASQLCVNRNNPSKHCEGQCFLNKQLDKQEKPDSPLSNISKEKFSVNLYFENTSLHTDMSLQQSTCKIPSQQHLFDSGLYGNLFHPPQV